MLKKKVEQIDDEIDLLELVESLWKEKVLIVAITTLITIIGLGYAMLTPSTYEARVEILPPSIEDIAELQKIDILKSPRTQTETQVYTEFLSILKSNQLRKKFLQEEGVMESLFEKETTQQKALAKLGNMINIKVPIKEPKRVSFKLQYSDADLVGKLANQFVDLAIGLYRTNIFLTFDSIKDKKIKELNNLKSSLIATYEGNFDYEITRLKAAYLLAKKLDIIETPEPKDQIVRASLGFVTEELRYFYSQGAKALDAEIEALTQLKKNHSQIDGLIKIEEELSLLNTLSFDASRVTPATIDLVAETPGYRIKPKRTRIVLLSGVIGGVVAIIFVLIRNALRNRKSHS